MKKKLYILDTNVLIHDPKALMGFSHADIGIPLTVIEELDHFKTDNSQRGYSAREAIRVLDAARAKGSLREGVALEHGGSIKILTYEESIKCDELFDEDSPDNRILSIAYCAQKKGRDVEFVTKDLNMRIKADAIGLRAVDYLKDVIHKDDFYRGWRELSVPAVQLKQSVPRDLLELAHDESLNMHEYVIVSGNNNPHNNRVFRYAGGKEFVAVTAPHLKWAIAPRNIQQLMALDMLLNDDIPLVSLLGPAGTGKTLLALVAALYKVLVEEVYTKVLVSRPIIPLGPDLGYLPGELQEKLYNWMQPVYDNMDFIAHLAHDSSKNGPQEEHETPAHYEKHRRGRHGRRHESWKARHRDGSHPLKLEQLIAQEKISLEAITYMRGRSIPYQYIFIDEVQNLTPHEVKTIVSRVGEGSKIVLAGDPYQIDSPYLDFGSNGLMVLTERLKGQPLFGTVFLEHSERSALSKLAGELL